MADYDSSFSVLFPVSSADNVKPALALYRQLADELDAGNEAIGFEAEADHALSGAHLWLHADGEGNPEHVITFALRCAKALDLQGLWGFRWSLSCSRPKLDGFGGGAQLLDLGRRCSADWTDCEHWLAQRIADLGTPRTPAEAIFRLVAQSQGWSGATVADLLLAFINAEIRTDPCTANRLQAYLARAAASRDEEGGTCGQATPGCIALQAAALSLEQQP